MKAKGQDPDGMDLYFTTGNVNLGNKEKASKFVAKMEEGYPKDGVRTNIIESLGTIFDKYLNSLCITSNQARNVTLIVLTDGAWDGTTNKERVSDKIVEFLEQLGKRTTTLKHRQFSIEFVQLGDDEEASKRLKHLDNFLREKQSGESTNQGPAKYKDMIDYEPASGDVNKMLLGSFVEAYDDDSDDDDSQSAGETSRLPSRQGPTSPQDALMSPSHQGTYEHELYTPLMSEE